MAEAEGIRTLIGKIVKDSRDYTALWSIEQGPWTPTASWMRERQFALDRTKALLVTAITRKQGGLASVSRAMLVDFVSPEPKAAAIYKRRTRICAGAFFKTPKPFF